MQKLKISHEPENIEAWVCICGNKTDEHGFYPCNSFGKKVRTDHNWKRHLFVCGNCGSVIDEKTLEVQ